jgi:hypothetical protein
MAEGRAAHKRAADALLSESACASSPARGSVATLRRGMRIIVRHASDGIGPSAPQRADRAVVHGVAFGPAGRARRPQRVNGFSEVRPRCRRHVDPATAALARHATRPRPATPARAGWSAGRHAADVHQCGGALAGAGRPKRCVWGRGCSGIRPGRAHKKSISGRNRAIGGGLQVQRPTLEIGGEMHDHVPARRLLPATREERRLRCDA